MRYLKPPILAAVAMFAFTTVGAAVAQAETAREPALLLLENGVTTLTAKFKGTTSSLATLSGKEIAGTGDSGEVKSCKNSGSEKDSTLCEVLLTFTGVKKETKVACRSETQNEKEKDAVETVLVSTDIHLASEETSGKILQTVALFKVLGEKSGEAAEELVINCGAVRERVKGVLPCLLDPGLENVPTSQEAEIACDQDATSHDQVTGKCALLCEWLTEHPFEANLGNGFEDAGMNVAVRGTFSKDIFLDD